MCVSYAPGNDISNPLTYPHLRYVKTVGASLQDTAGRVLSVFERSDFEECHRPT